MKQFISILILVIAITALCVWDGVHTEKIFAHMKTESQQIETLLETKDISNAELQNKIISLSDYWTDQMDLLCVSISRKDLQPISDYLQYLLASIQNNSNEDAVTYSKLLSYNITGVYETTCIDGINLL